MYIFHFDQLCSVGSSNRIHRFFFFFRLYLGLSVEIFGRRGTDLQFTIWVKSIFMLTVDIEWYDRILIPHFTFILSFSISNQTQDSKQNESKTKRENKINGISNSCSLFTKHIKSVDMQCNTVYCFYYLVFIFFLFILLKKTEDHTH